MNTGVGIGIGFVAGLGIGVGVTYILTKRKCDEETQRAIDEMKEYYKEKEPKKDESDSKEEQKESKETEKPDITESSSIVDSDTNNDTGRTHYSTINTGVFTELKEKIKKDKEEPVKKASLTIVNYDVYNELLADEYTEMEFTFNTDEGVWRDWTSDAEYEVDNLPFDADAVQWNENEQCYICDRENKTVYLLEKV